MQALDTILGIVVFVMIVSIAVNLYGIAERR